MPETCYEVITWLQTLTVASVMLNFLLVGLVGVAFWELRQRERPAEVLRPGLARPDKRFAEVRATHNRAKSVVAEVSGKPAPWYPD